MRNPKCFKSIYPKIRCCHCMTYWLTRATYRSYRGENILCICPEASRKWSKPRRVFLQKPWDNNLKFAISGHIANSALLFHLVLACSCRAVLSAPAMATRLKDKLRPRWREGRLMNSASARNQSDLISHFPKLSHTNPSEKREKSSEMRQTGRFKTGHKWRPEAFHPSSELALQKRVLFQFPWRK